MSDAVTISREELQAIMREAVRDALHDVGLRADEPKAVEEAREDFRFVRRLRQGVDGVASKVGMAIVLSIVGGLITILTFGLKAFLGR